MKIFECLYFGFWVEFYWVANPIHIQWLVKIFKCQYFGFWVEFYWVGNPIYIQWLMKIFEYQYFGFWVDFYWFGKSNNMKLYKPVCQLFLPCDNYSVLLYIIWG